MKIKVSQAQSNWFVFKEAPAIKEGCADLHNPDMNRVKWVQTATHGDAIRVHELVAEKSLKQLLFE